MKKEKPNQLQLHKVVILLLLLIPILTYAQPPHWKAGGNPVFGVDAVNAGNSILGPDGNFPLNIQTNGIQRMRLNGTSGASSGYLGIAPSGYFANNSPLSMIHLYGPDNSGFSIGGGWRNWMQTGMFSNENSDYMYIGMKSEGVNRSDAIIAFGDDGAPNTIQNNLRFISTSPSSNPAAGHLELGRFTFDGNFGVGPVFTNNNQPTSLVHLNRSGNAQTWLQITNQNGTGQTVNDGLRFGVRPNRTAYLRQQENQPFIIQTDWNNGAGGINGGERMRITSIGAPGIPNPAGAANNNITRVAISHTGTNPITEPRSLLHLGYNRSSWKWSS